MNAYFLLFSKIEMYFYLYAFTQVTLNNRSVSIYQMTLKSTENDT